MGLRGVAKLRFRGVDQCARRSQLRRPLGPGTISWVGDDGSMMGRQHRGPDSQPVPDDIHDRMRQSIRTSRQVLDHAGEKGASIERIIRSGLRDILPEKVGVGHGFVIDSFGGRSKQMDIILYDRLDAPQFFPLRGVQVLPVETTYACGEVKARLRSGDLENCLNKCTSYKSLRRAAYFETPDMEGPSVKGWVFVVLSEPSEQVVLGAGEPRAERPPTLPRGGGRDPKLQCRGWDSNPHGIAPRRF